jgi:hypothetical protein
MNKLIIIAFFCTLSISSAGVWKPLNKSLYDYDINDIKIVDETNIVAVGDFGSIYKINLPGTDKVEYVRAVESDGSLLNIEYIDGIFYAVGENGLLLTSTDMGNNWNRIDLDLQEDIKAIGVIDKEIYMVNNKSIMHYNSSTNQITVIKDDLDDWNAVLFESNTIYFVGDNGHLATYDFEDGYIIQNSGYQTDITTVFSDGESIYFTPKQEYVQKTDKSLNTIEPVEIGSKLNIVVAAEINANNDIIIFGVMGFSVHLVLRTTDETFNLQNSINLPYISKFVSENDITLYSGKDGILGYIPENIDIKTSFPGFNLVFHFYRPTFKINDIYKKNDELIILERDKFSKLNNHDNEIDSISSFGFDYLVDDNLNDEKIVIRRSWAGNNKWRMVLSKISNGQIIDIDSTQESHLNYLFYESDTHVYVSGRTYLYMVNKETLETEEIIGFYEKDFFIYSIVEYNNELYALGAKTTGGFSIFKNIDFENWSEYYSFENLAMPNMTVINDQIHIGGTRGNPLDFSYHLINIETEDELFNYKSIYHGDEIIFYDDFMSIATGSNNIIAYTMDNGSSWTVDSVDKAVQVYGTHKLGNYLYSFTNNDIFVKNLTKASINEQFENGWTKHNSFSLYPNPSPQNPAVSISVLDITGKAEYTIFDITGKVLKSGIAEGNKLNIQGLNSGSYIVFLESNNQSYAAQLKIE